MDRRYEIFVSSTKNDLELERVYIQEQIIKTGNIPIAMELFLGARRSIWSVIKSAIDSCDFYILILAGRYGAATGIRGKSYTEKEFDYALKIKKPIIAFVLDNKGLGNISVKDSEIQKNKKKLDAFRAKVMSQHVQQYSSFSNLKTIFPVNMQKFIDEHDNPDFGWIKADVFNAVLKKSLNFKTDSDIYRFMFNSLSRTKNVPCDLKFCDIDLDPAVDDIGAMLKNLANLLLKYVDTVTNPNVDIYFACKLDPFNAKESKYAIVIGRKSIDSNGNDRLLDESSNCHYVFENNTHRYLSDINKVKNSSNQFLQGENSLLSIPISVNRKCVGVIGFSSNKTDGLSEDQAFALNEAKPLCEGIFESYSRKNGLSSNDNEAEKLQQLIAGYIGLDAGKYQNITIS